MSNEALEQRRQLVLNSIARCDRAWEMWKDGESNPATTEKQRKHLKDVRDQTELEFGWQWRNVKVILGGSDGK